MLSGSSKSKSSSKAATISGSMSSRGAALFRSPTSSSNSEANTEDGRWSVDPLSGCCR
uniref:Uncharacterized protein n=1 Tax=Cyprinodon variegatus TaxID=28743 RepID=A0A3Q2GQH6_CYPVA